MARSWLDNLIYIPPTTNTTDVKKPEKKPERSGWVLWETIEEVERKIREKNQKILNPSTRK